MDTTEPAIIFAADGTCNHCTAALERIKKQILPPLERRQSLQQLVELVKKEGRGNTYDCIIGVSGGIDSTTTAFWVKEVGLRPLAVHFDNGWDSELAVANIKKTLEYLGIELFTYVVDWEEFRDLQLSFLKASVANAEIPTDHGITALLFRTARQRNVRFILTGSNVASESIMPLTWGHYNQDLKHLKALHRRFGSVPLRTMPMISLKQYMYSVFIRGIRQIPFLNYIDYNKIESKQLLIDKLGWRDYGAKHYESVWTRFFQGYYLPVKFGFDKRKAHFSSLICAGQMTRQEALLELDKPPYDPVLLRQDMQFVLKKFRLSESEFQAILNAPPRLATEYPGHHLLLYKLGPLKEKFRSIAIAAR